MMLRWQMMTNRRVQQGLTQPYHNSAVSGVHNCAVTQDGSVRHCEWEGPLTCGSGRLIGPVLQTEGRQPRADVGVDSVGRQNIQLEEHSSMQLALVDPPPKMLSQRLVEGRKSRPPRRWGGCIISRQPKYS